ncbi:MAG: DNA methyltransferase [Xanthobacteraceae bacterium]
MANYSLLPVSELKPHPRNPRKHTHAQIRALARSIEIFRFNAPILIDKDKHIVAGHGRYEAARYLGLTEVPVIHLDHLSQTQAQAYMLADNKLTDRSSWDDAALAVHLMELSELALDFEIEATGFEAPEIDIRIQSHDQSGDAERADDFELPSGPPVSTIGDLWILDGHRLICGNACEKRTYDTILDKEKATAAFTDPPYNVPVDGHVTGKGRIKHREFPMATGEMSEVEFSDFLKTALSLIRDHAVGSALIYACMDWRHMAEMQAAGRAAGFDLINLCVWAKTNGGMGSLYRSRHELVFVFRNGEEPHLNNVQLGRFGRNRSNVWNYPGMNTFPRGGLKFHPTVKPILLVADAILDSTKRNDIILDPFVGSGTTILAAERTNRRCYGIEIDPLYVDTSVERWQRMTGEKARNRDGVTFDEIKLQRSVEP